MVVERARAHPSLNERRKLAGWTQVEVAERLGVTQAYLSMLERGQRTLPPDLARKLMRLYGLSPTVLPVPKSLEVSPSTRPEELMKELAALGYPGFAHVQSRKLRNPAEVLLSALAQNDLESRLAEALPWVVFRYPDLPWEWLRKVAKANDLQNRLGFVVTLARRLAEAEPSGHKTAQQLAEQEEKIERSRLEREDTFSKESLTSAERSWLAQRRPADAARWHLLTDLSPTFFSYATTGA